MVDNGNRNADGFARLDILLSDVIHSHGIGLDSAAGQLYLDERAAAEALGDVEPLQESVRGVQIEATLVLLADDGDGLGVLLAACVVDGQRVTYVDATLRNEVGLVECYGDETGLCGRHGLHCQVSGVLAVLYAQLGGQEHLQVADTLGGLQREGDALNSRSHHGGIVQVDGHVVGLSLGVVGDGADLLLTGVESIAYAVVSGTEGHVRISGRGSVGLHLGAQVVNLRPCYLRAALLAGTTVDGLYAVGLRTDDVVVERSIRSIGVDVPTVLESIRNLRHGLLQIDKVFRRNGHRLHLAVHLSIQLVAQLLRHDVVAVGVAAGQIETDVAPTIARVIVIPATLIEFADDGGSGGSGYLLEGLDGSALEGIEVVHLVLAGIQQEECAGRQRLRGGVVVEGDVAVGQCVFCVILVIISVVLLLGSSRHEVLVIAGNLVGADILATLECDLVAFNSTLHPGLRQVLVDALHVDVVAVEAHLDQRAFIALAGQRVELGLQSCGSLYQRVCNGRERQVPVAIAGP